MINWWTSLKNEGVDSKAWPILFQNFVKQILLIVLPKLKTPEPKPLNLNTIPEKKGDICFLQRQKKSYIGI